MAYEMTDRENDTLVRGSSIEFVVDDEKDIGEVYLDGNLIFQEKNSEEHLRYTKPNQMKIQLICQVT